MVRVASAALALGVATFLAPAAARPGRAHVRVAPASGAPPTRFVVSFRAPDRTGRHGSAELHDELAGSLSAAAGCVARFSLRAPDAAAGARVRVALDPGLLGGQWCVGTYHGQITELQTPVCMRATACPHYVIVRRRIAAFTFAVLAAAPPAPQPPPPPAGADVTPPVFAGLEQAFACTPGPQRPGQTTPFNLSWQEASDDAAAPSQIVYDIYLATAPGGEDFSHPAWTTAPGAVSFRTPGLGSHGTFYFVVRARDPAGNEDGNTVERRGVDPCV